MGTLFKQMLIVNYFTVFSKTQNRKFSQQKSLQAFSCPRIKPFLLTFQINRLLDNIKITMSRIVQKDR